MPQERALVTRPAVAPRGRALPTRLTPTGRQHLHEASVAVRAVEKAMLSRLPHTSRHTLLEDLATCAATLSAGADGG